MKQMIKKLLTVAILLSVTLSAWAYDFKVDGIYYNINDDGTTVSVTNSSNGIQSYSGSVEVPSKVTYSGTTYLVSLIGDEAFRYCSGLTSVTIHNSVTSIGNYAFSGCSGLTSITIPIYLTSIGDNAFDNCRGLTSITIPESVTSIGDYAFNGCSGLTSITIPESVTSIGNSAFSGCSGLTSVSIGDSVTSIGDYVFNGCSGLTSVTIPNSVTYIGDYAFNGCSGLTSVIIPESVKSIGVAAFRDCAGLKSVTIPNSVTSIGYDAFISCTGLKSVNISNSVTTIEQGTFAYCSGLTSVTIPNSVTSIGKEALTGCSGMTTVTIGSSVASIGNYAFSGCSRLTSVTIPNSVTSIGRSAFLGCTGLKQLTIQDGTSTLSLGSNYLNPSTEVGFFYDAPLESVYIGRNIYVVGGYRPFYDKPTIKELTIGNSVTSIDSYSFSGCWGLTSVSIGNSVTSIGNWAFEFCKGLTSVTIPNSVTSIGSGAFSSCTRLTSVTIPNSVTSIGNYTFEGCCGMKKLTIQDGTSILYLGANSKTGRGLFYDAPLESVYLGRNLTYDTSKECGYSPFYGNSTIKELTIGNFVTSIGLRAFMGCSGLILLDIPDSVTSIDGSAFEGCSGLTSISIGDSVTSIGNRAFYSCSGLTSVTIPNLVTSIGKEAFSDCHGLTSVTISNSVTSIGDNAFSNCSGLANIGVLSGNSIYDSRNNCKAIIKTDSNLLLFGCKNTLIPNSVTSIGSGAFMGCSEMTSIAIPNSVTEIGGSAFEGCSGLTSVSIGDSVNSIGDSAFSGCSGLTSVTIPNSVTLIGNNVFDKCNGLSRVVALAETPPTATSETFGSSVTSSASLYVKKNTINKYFLADGWCDFINTQAISKLVTQISLEKTFLKVGETTKLKATVEPVDATLTDLIWCTSNSCVSVVQDGNIKGLSEGQCIVTAEAIDGSGIKAECIVNVGNIYAESISLSKEVGTLEINGLTKLSYTIFPDNVAIKTVECSSSDESVAVCKVNNDNTITVLGLSSGVATITVRTTDGTNRSASCTFYVGDSGTETIDSDSVKVTTEGGAIHISGAAGAVAEVYSLSGVLLYRGTDAAIAIPRGVYIVKVAGTTKKVIL